MVKKLIPLALIGLLSGCAAFQEAAGLQDSIKTFLVRSITMKVGAEEQCRVALIWSAPMSSLKRGSTEITGIDKSKGGAGEDQVTPDGTTYTYTAVFTADNGGTPKTVSRPIQPLAIGDAGTAQAIAPDATIAELATGGPTVARSGLKFQWKMSDAAKPTGFMVTVTDTAAPTVPLYNAFIQAASHSVGADAYEVAFGTRSDMALMTKEITELLKGMDPKFSQKDEGVSSDQLDPSKSYAWIVSPITVDEKAIRFAVGVSDGSPFKVSQ